MVTAVHPSDHLESLLFCCIFLLKLVLFSLRGITAHAAHTTHWSSDTGQEGSIPGTAVIQVLASRNS